MRVPTVGVVILSSDHAQVLLVRHEDGAGHLTGTYGLPAGRIDNGETPVQAAVRELEEESGLVTSVDALTELPKTYDIDVERKNGAILSVHHTVFLCKKFSGELKSSHETTPLWVAIDQISTLRLLPNTIDMITQAKQGYGI